MSEIASGTFPDVYPPGIHNELAPVSFPLGSLKLSPVTSSTSTLTNPPPSLKYPLGKPSSFSIIDISPFALRTTPSQYFLGNTNTVLSSGTPTKPFISEYLIVHHRIETNAYPYILY